jgi:hypothetical protein
MQVQFFGKDMERFFSKSTHVLMKEGNIKVHAEEGYDNVIGK